MSKTFDISDDYVKPTASLLSRNRRSKSPLPQATTNPRKEETELTFLVDLECQTIIMKTTTSSFRMRRIMTKGSEGTQRFRTKLAILTRSKYKEASLCTMILF